jgi:hypothetical protein
MLDKICTNLETSKRLKELGVEIKSSTFWCLDDDPFIVVDDTGMKGEYECQCYFLEQIIKILPKEIEADFDEETQTYRSTYIFKLSTAENGYFMGYVNLISDNIYIDFRCIKDNLATTAARLLIKLIEDKII